MSWELVYTSVRRGLRPNTSGFCTVAVTAGMSRAVMQTIERISAYEFHFGLSDPRANENPVNYLHMLLGVAGKPMHLLSRIAYAGADYSGRTNKIAHHILLSPDELSPAGPADMIRQLVNAGRFCSTWSGEPRELPPSSLAAGLGASPAHAGPPATWRGLTGDAGWAGMLVKGFRENARVPAYLLFEPGLDILQLYQESLALLPPELRWEVGFSTYYYANLLPADSKVHWRAVVSGSPLARTEVTKYPNAVVLDLTLPLGSPPANLFVTAAREGHPIEPSRSAPAQSQGRPGGASIDISQALNRRQPAPVSKDLLNPTEYEAPSPQQPSAALQPALADYGYPDYSQKTVDITPRRTSRWTWVFAAAAFLLLLSNAVTLILGLGRADSQDSLIAQLKETGKKLALEEKARVNFEQKWLDANSEIQKLRTQLAALAPASKPTKPPEAVVTRDGEKKLESPREPSSATASHPATQPACATPPTSVVPSQTAAQNLARRIPFTKHKTSSDGGLPSQDSDLSPPLAPGGSSSVQVTDATTILDPKGRLADYVYLKVNGEGNEPNAVFYVKAPISKEPDYTRPLATCWLEDKPNGRFMHVTTPMIVSDTDAVLRDSLVILLAGSDGKLSYRCPLLKTSPVEVSLKVAHDKATVDEEVIRFNYQCPDNLMLLFSDKSDPRKITSVDNQSFNGFKQSPAVAIRINKKTCLEVTLSGAIGMAKTLSTQITQWHRDLAPIIKKANIDVTVARCIMNTSSQRARIGEKEKQRTQDKEGYQNALEKDKKDRKLNADTARQYRNEIQQCIEELGALGEIRTALDRIEEKKNELRSHSNETVILFQDPSGHIVQKITLKVIWGDKGK